MTYDLSAAQERDMDARAEAHQDRLDDEREQRERLGFEVGDRVTVGSGKKVWVVHSFWEGYHNGPPLARLEPVDGYTSTSVEVGRLKAATS